MTKFIKALLFSGLVFPGTGQLIYKRYKSATIYICASLIAIFIIGMDVFKKASVITEKILSEGVNPDYTVIKEMISDQQVNSDSQLITITLFSLLIIWLLSIIDIFRLRNKTTN